MKVIFLDFDGVINSHQSATFWHNKRDQAKWENEMYASWTGTLREYIAQEFCPIALSNVEELCRRVPDLKIVVSSTWRLGETPDTLRKILSPSKIIGDRIIDTTPAFRWVKHRQELGESTRGHEIEDWLERHPEVTHYAIIDDDSDMLESQKNNFVHTSSLHGYQYGDLLWTLRILGEGNQQ